MRVLVVEDDDDTRRLESDLLDGEGHEVVAVASAEEAERVIREVPVDALVVDVFLDRAAPGALDTLGLLRLCRRTNPRARLVVVSGAAGARERLEPECDAFLLKPIGVERLLAVLRGGS